MGFHDNIIDIVFYLVYGEARLEMASQILVQIEPRYTRLLCWVMWSKIEDDRVSKDVMVEIMVEFVPLNI